MEFNVCFVCTGNAARSPYAETVLKALLAKEGMDQIGVFSMGTLDWGSNPRDPMMVQIAKERGYELTGTTVCMTRSTLLVADLIIVFDVHHRNACTRVLDYAYWDRIVSFNQYAFGKEGNVEDPHYQSEALYRQVAELIEHGCQEMVARWKVEPPRRQI